MSVRGAGCGHVGTDACILCAEVLYSRDTAPLPFSPAGRDCVGDWPNMPVTQDQEAGNKRPRTLKRIVRSACTVIVVLLVLAGGWHCHMHKEAEREGRRIAEDEEYGAAWETIDCVGQGDLGVLFFHNLHGTPQDFKLLYDELEKRGIHYYTPMLGGERPSPAIQSGFTSATFAAHAERAYKHLARRCTRIIVVGASAGGVQAADVASRFPVERAVLIAPAFGIIQRPYLKPSTEFWTRRLAPVLPLVRKPKKASIDDDEALAAFKGFQIMALGGAAAFFDYRDAVLAQTDAIEAPVLCVLSRSDVVVDDAVAEAVVEDMTSADKRFFYVDESNHLILVDYGREKAAAAIQAFILEAFDAKQPASG